MAPQQKADINWAGGEHGDTPPDLPGESSTVLDVAMLRIVSLAVTLAVCAGRPSQWDDQLGLFPADGGASQPTSLRAVANPTTPNQILDAVVEGANEYMRNLGWCESKNVRNGESHLPLQVDAEESSSETLVITKANVTGLCSLRRSKSASFSSDQSVLSGSVVVDDARANAKYTVSFPGVKQAPAQSIDGQVVELAKLFADIKINLEGLVPQNIASYEARFGHDGLENVTNLAGSEMEAVHIAGIRKALREILVKVMSTNVKVQINKSIQNMKNA
ncbi:uncharacterized protein LOC122256827 [Penaeus japonicus]|uniref:uncharacterized protein LOC122256827 n=1 Tax=Penaeus japonicus TaxID=27405 RepID=UPI001C70C058|nr:uncharacterized protein LOC122256827 [Penaeus japonicus]